MIRFTFIICIIIGLSCGSCFSQENTTTASERSYIQTFLEFSNYLNDLVKSKKSIKDTSQLTYLFVHFLFVNSKVESSTNHLLAPKLTNDQLFSLRENVKSFYRLLQENQSKSLAENIAAMPLRLSNDKSIYNRLTSFQKENTLIFYDKRNSSHVLGYILFMPAINSSIPKPKIWSWTLVYKFGKFTYQSLTGEEGQEYIFEK